MLRGTNKVTNAIALAVEKSLPYATSPVTGWREVTPGRKVMCVEAAREAALALDRIGYVIVRKPKQ